MQIEDGKGTGKRVQVTDNNELLVHSHMVENIETINANTGKVWSISMDALAPSGATWFFYFANNGQTNYAIYRMVLATSVAGVFRIGKVTGTPSGGSVITPVSLNLSIVTTPDLLTIQGGASITGLTESFLVAPLYIPANQLFNIELTSKIIITPGTALAIKAPASATVNGFISFFEINELE